MAGAVRGIMADDVRTMSWTASQGCRSGAMLRLNAFTLYDVRHGTDKLTISDEMLHELGVVHAAVIQVFRRVI